MKSIINWTLCLLFSVTGTIAFGQAAVNSTSATPDASAMLDVSSSEKGVLIPRMTEVERDGINMPATGLLIFQEDGTQGFYFYNGAAWEMLEDRLSSMIINNYFLSTSNLIIYDNLLAGNETLTTVPFEGPKLVLRDSVLRIEFDDTSNTGSFPNTHWELRFNDADQGGKNAFMIYDRGPGNSREDEVFTVEAGAGDDAFYIDGSGNLGLGTDMPGEKLDVAGNMHAEGDITVTGSIMSVSDARLKKDVKPLGNGTAVIDQLEPKQYDFRTAAYKDLNLAKGKQFGFVAQELELVLPELVSNSLTAENEVGEYEALKTVNYVGLVPVLIKAMQERQVLIEQQQREIEETKAAIAEMKNLQTQLESLRAVLYDADGNLNAELAAKLRDQLK